MYIVVYNTCRVVIFFVVYPMLPFSLDCLLLIAPSVFSNVYFVLCTLCYRFLWIVYYWFAPSVFSNVYFVLCTLCYRFLWIVYYWFAPSVFSNVYFVLCTLCFRFLWIVCYWFAPSVFSNVYFVLCTLCCRFLWIVCYWLPLQCSLMCISSCVPYVSNFSGLFVIDCPFSVL